MRKGLALAVCLLLGAGVAGGQELTANIERRVNAITLDLDKAEDLIRRGSADLAERYIVGARKEYAKIFEYYPGQFDPDHPTLVALEKRIEDLAIGVVPGPEPPGEEEGPTGNGSGHPPAR